MIGAEQQEGEMETQVTEVMSVALLAKESRENQTGGQCGSRQTLERGCGVWLMRKMQPRQRRRKSPEEGEEPKPLGRPSG